MQISCKEENAVLTVQVSGDLTFADYSQWRTMFELALSIHPKEIILDLSKLTTLDSAAFGLIHIFQAKAINEVIEFVIIQPKDGFLQNALNCPNIQCIPNLNCNNGKESCAQWQDIFGPLKVKEDDTTS